MRAQPDAELRAARLADLRRQIAADVYVTEAKLSAAVDGLLEEVVAGEGSVSKDMDDSAAKRRPR